MAIVSSWLAGFRVCGSVLVTVKSSSCPAALAVRGGPEGHEPSCTWKTSSATRPWARRCTAAPRIRGPRLHSAEHLARLLHEPAAQVADVVGALALHVRLVGPGHVLGAHPASDRVHV